MILVVAKMCSSVRSFGRPQNVLLLQKTRTIINILLHINKHKSCEDPRTKAKLANL